MLILFGLYWYNCIVHRVVITTVDNSLSASDTDKRDKISIVLTEGYIDNLLTKFNSRDTSVTLTTEAQTGTACGIEMPRHNDNNLSLVIDGYTIYVPKIDDKYVEVDIRKQYNTYFVTLATHYHTFD